MCQVSLGLKEVQKGVHDLKYKKVPYFARKTGNINTYMFAAPKLALVPAHYENTPMQYTAIFHGCKKDNFQIKNYDIYLIFAQNIDCGYTLEPPH